MTSERTPLIATPPPPGAYQPAATGDVRSPCPLVNCLANHGYIPRSGKSVRASEIYSALSAIGLSRALRAVFSYPIYNEHVDPKKPTEKLSLVQKLFAILRNPWSILTIFGMRNPGQVDARGRKVLNLDQMSAHGAVEHDVSMTRHDYLQGEERGTPKPGENCKLQKDLVDQLVKCSSDGKVITMKDLAALRRLRIQQQLAANPRLEYGELEHTLACGEIALILSVFGDGESVPVKYVEALFRDERLPVQEGWKKRWWWTLGLIELGKLGNKVKGVVGLTFSSEK